MDYCLFYDMVVDEIEDMKRSDVTGDERLCKEMVSLYELRDYLINRMAEEGRRLRVELSPKAE